MVPLAHQLAQVVGDDAFVGAEEGTITKERHILQQKELVI